MKKQLVLITSLFTTLITAPAIAGSFLLEEYNLVTIGSVNSNSMHVHGKALIGGNLNSTSSNVGFGLDAPYENATTLTVAGSVNSGQGFTAKGYSIVGDSNNVTNPNNANQYYVNNREIKNTKGVTKQDLSSLPADIKNNLESNSTYFKNLTTNSTISKTGDSVNQTYSFDIDSSLTSSDIAVFSLKETQDIFSNNINEKYEISSNQVNNVAGIIINVAGANITQENTDHFTGFSKTPSVVSKIIWNFYEATTITLNTNFVGNILAPLANLASTGGDIDGAVGVLSIRSDHNSQIHDFNAKVTKPTVTEVPEPSTWLLFGFSFIALLVMRKRKQ